MFHRNGNGQEQSTKDNLGTLSINRYLTGQPTSQTFDFG